MTPPVFIMPTLGRRGRFANQLFQYAYLRIAAEQRGAIVQTPAWSGQELFGWRDPLVEEGPITATVNDRAIDDHDLYLNRTEPIGERVEFIGFFQCHSRHFLPHREFLRRLFVFRPDLQKRFGEVVEQLRQGGRPLVAVHLRRGDYGEGQFFRAPVKWYADWLDSAAAPRDPAIYLCSEEPAALVDGFRPRTVMHAGLLPNLSPRLASILDFYVLTQADALAISNSSFSFMASMLNERAATFVRPRSTTGACSHSIPGTRRSFSRGISSRASRRNWTRSTQRTLRPRWFAPDRVGTGGSVSAEASPGKAARPIRRTRKVGPDGRDAHPYLALDLRVTFAAFAAKKRRDFGAGKCRRNKNIFFIPSMTYEVLSEGGPGNANTHVPMNMSLEIEPEARLDCVVEEVAEARRCGNTELAKKILRYARGLTPHTVEDELALCFLNLESGDLYTALRWFSNVVELRPGLAAAHSGLALTLQLLEQPVEALNALMRALALDSKDLIALKVLLRINLNMCMYPDARRICERILALSPDDADATAMLRQPGVRACRPFGESSALWVGEEAEQEGQLEDSTFAGAGRSDWDQSIALNEV